MFPLTPSNGLLHSLTHGICFPSRRKHPRGGALAATAETSTAFGTKTSLKILLANQVNFGERHAVFGAGDALKNWQEAVEMHWTDGGWVLDVSALQPGQKVKLFSMHLGAQEAAVVPGFSNVIRLGI